MEMIRTFRRPLCWTMCLLVLFAAVSPVLASAQGVEELFTENSPSKAALDAAGASDVAYTFYYKDTCYIYTDDETVYTYTSQDGVKMLCQLPPRPKALDDYPVKMKNINKDELDNMVNRLLPGEDGVYGYNLYAGRFGRVDESGIHWSDVKMDFSSVIDEKEFSPKLTRDGGVISGDQLYINVIEMGDDSDAKQTETLYGFHLNTGKATAYGENLGITNMFRGKDGTILYTRFFQGKMGLFQLDPASGKEAQLPMDLSKFTEKLKLGGFVYDDSTDAIWFFYGTTLYRSADGKTLEQVTILPSSRASEGDPAWILSNGRYAFRAFLGGGILVCPVSGVD